MSTSPLSRFNRLTSPKAPIKPSFPSNPLSVFLAIVLFVSLVLLILFILAIVVLFIIYVYCTQKEEEELENEMCFGTSLKGDPIDDITSTQPIRPVSISGNDFNSDPNTGRELQGGPASGPNRATSSSKRKNTLERPGEGDEGNGDDNKNNDKDRTTSR